MAKGERSLHLAGVRIGFLWSVHTRHGWMDPSIHCLHSCKSRTTRCLGSAGKVTKCTEVRGWFSSSAVANCNVLVDKLTINIFLINQRKYIVEDQTASAHFTGKSLRNVYVMFVWRCRERWNWITLGNSDPGRCRGNRKLCWITLTEKCTLKGVQSIT